MSERPKESKRVSASSLPWVCVLSLLFLMGFAIGRAQLRGNVYERLVSLALATLAFFYALPAALPYARGKMLANSKGPVSLAKGIASLFRGRRGDNKASEKEDAE